MNDNPQGRNESPNYAPLVGFALGAVVGGVLALMLAPDSGEKTRRRIGEAARRMGNNARHTMDEARETVTEAASGLGEDVKSAITAGRDAFRHDGEKHEPRGSRVAQLVTPTPPRTP